MQGHLSNVPWLPQDAVPSCTAPELANCQRVAAAAATEIAEQDKDSCVTTLSCVLGFCSKQLGLQGLACLAASSKVYQEACQMTAASNAPFLLLAAINAASAEKHLEAVTWLLRVAPSTATAATAAQHLSNLPCVQLPAALRLVAAGVRISFSLLSAAADSMVAGVEVWAQAQQQLGVQTDIPAAAVVACKRHPDVRQFDLDELPAHEAPAVLQLGMNGLYHNTAEAAADLLLDLLHGDTFIPSDALSRLFVTAAARQHRKALQLMTGLPPVMYSLDGAALSAMYGHLIAANDWLTMEVLHRELLNWKLQPISSEAAVGLLQAAMQRHCRQAAILRHGRHAAMQRQSNFCMETLCKMQSVRKLGVQSTAQLLQAAVEVGCSECTLELCRLPAAKQLTAVTVTQLLEAALQQCTDCSMSSVEPLLRLPAAKQLSASTVKKVLQAALKADEPSQGGAAAAAERLFKLPAAKQLSAGTVAQLLQAALEKGRYGFAHSVSTLPAARLLSTSEVNSLRDTCNALQNGAVFSPLVERLGRLVERLRAAEERDRVAS